jgi:hypothetical protein
VSYERLRTLEGLGASSPSSFTLATPLKPFMQLGGTIGNKLGSAKVGAYAGAAVGAGLYGYAGWRICRWWRGKK